MYLRGIDYGPISCASGARGMFGEGYWFHQFIPSLERLTFAAKTVTVPYRKGNMPLNKVTWQPKERFPKCIKVDFLKGIAINAVGLSNFGFEAALQTGRWQAMTKPFFLSFMPVGATKEVRLSETCQFAEYLKAKLWSFKGKVALQVNLSCPNTGENLKELEEEAVEILKLLLQIGIPILPKFNVITSPATVKRISQEVAIDGVCISNTIPYGQLPEAISWNDMFGTVSPLESLGGGGLSGAPLFDLVLDWVKRARDSDMNLPLVAGGGIMHARQVRTLFNAGANSAAIATVIMLRPWRVPSIIEAAYSYL
jgi:dihydroorotate dehydrogenase